MLSFMRKHQKYFFVVITFVIVISFSFFGTYSTLAGNSIHEQTAFTTVTGDAVSRSELEDMALFIGTDGEDKKLFGGAWGPNFLNDGVIRKNFLDNGLAVILIENYSGNLQGDLKNRFAKEVRYQPYTHPQAKFVSSTNVWNYFAPEISSELNILQKSKDPLEKAAINARTQLFLSERKFPSPYLKQVLKYQENQSRVERDPDLERQDLSLFGYHTVEDWFGSRFIHLISEFIFNAAGIAEQRGYSVSKEEALADLMRNSELSFNENKSNPRIGVSNSREYFDQQLLRMRLDKSKAAKIWQKVLLFRRLFDDVASSVFVDPFSYETFNQFAGQGVTGDLYQLPENLRFSDFKTLQKFEVYLDLISKRSKEEKGSLLMPKELLSVESVAKKAPELVQRQFLLEVAQVSKRNLQAKVSVKDTFSWEVDEKNWKSIKTQFPALGAQKGATQEERLNAIESLDERSRLRLDQFAREQIVSTHPEWIGLSLDDTPLRPINIRLSLKGGNAAFEGLEKGESLIALLDKQEPGSLINEVSFDKENFYRIRVIEKSSEPQIVTFAEANKSSLLDTLTNQALEIAYVQLRTEDPSAYQNSDKSWKPLEQVKEKVALAYFGKTLDAIRSGLKERSDKDKYKNLEGERLTPYRFLAWADDLRKKAEKGINDGFVAEEGASDYKQQFKWRKTPLRLSRKSDKTLAESEKLLNLAPNSWSETVAAPNGDVYFAFVADQLQSGASDEFLQEQVLRARYLLGNDAERSYLYSIIPLLKDKQGISFDYLHAGETSMEEES